MKGKFIVFEGIDGCGKGTQLHLASYYIFDLNKNNDLYLTREPTRDFKEIRDRLANGKDVKKDGEWYTKMFVEDRKNHIEKYIKPHINNGTHVLCDRYKYSTFAYQQAQGINLKNIINLHEGFLVPDLTLIFDCPAEIAFERRKNSGATEVFDKNLKFLKELRDNYLNLSRILKENIIVIDSTPKVETVFEDVKKNLDFIFF